MKAFFLRRILPSFLCWFVAGAMYVLIPLIAMGLGFQVIAPRVASISKFYEPVLLLLFPLACILVFLVVRTVELGSSAAKKKWPNSKWFSGASVIGNEVFKKSVRDECIAQIISLASISVAIGMTLILSHFFSRSSVPGPSFPGSEIFMDILIGVVLWAVAGIWEAITP